MIIECDSPNVTNVRRPWMFDVVDDPVEDLPGDFAGVGFPGGYPDGWDPDDDEQEPEPNTVRVLREVGEKLAEEDGFSVVKEESRSDGGNE